jgi:hypothetical protein
MQAVLSKSEGGKTMFTLKIRLGNDAMQDPADVAEALERVARELRDSGFRPTRIKDLNGNTVGEWKLTGK